MSSREFFQKNEWMNSFLLLCDVFSFIFWKKLKTPKRHFEIIWHLSALHRTNLRWWFLKNVVPFSQNLNCNSRIEMLPTKILQNFLLAVMVTFYLIMNSRFWIWKNQALIKMAAWNSKALKFKYPMAKNVWYVGNSWKPEMPYLPTIPIETEKFYYPDKPIFFPQGMV